MKQIAIIILNWNGAKDTIECLESLNIEEQYDVYLLDNGSRKSEIDPIIEYIQNSKYKNNSRIAKDIQQVGSYSLQMILSDANMGFARGNNYVASKIVDHYSYIMLLNNDTVVSEETINSVKEVLIDSDSVAATCDIRFYYDKTKLWNAGGKLTWYKDRKYYSQSYIERLKKKGERYIYAEFITGCALMIDSKYIIKYGLFTEDFFHGEEDFNFCINVLKRGYKLSVDLSSQLYHKVGQSLKPDANREKNYNATTLHYCNRIIDYKKMMKPVCWKLWREIYLCLAFVQRVRSNMSILTAYKLVRRVKKITSNNDYVKKELYDSIMSNKFI